MYNVNRSACISEKNLSFPRTRMRHRLSVSRVKETILRKIGGRRECKVERCSVYRSEKERHGQICFSFTSYERNAPAGN